MIKNNNLNSMTDETYYTSRLKRIDFRYRLKRRSLEVVNAILKYNNSPEIIVDVGTVDGEMLKIIKSKIKAKTFIGLDIVSKGFKAKDINFIQASVYNLPFKNNSIDVIIAAAVLEHLEDHQRVIKEFFKVLKENGLLILTFPNPFFDGLAQRIGYLSTKDHKAHLSLHFIINMLKKNNFQILEKSYFMFFPFFEIPGEKKIEGILKLSGLQKLMVNQLIIAKK